MKRIIATMAAALLLYLPAEIFAGIEPSPFTPQFENEIFWVLFNPQPEPPGSLLLGVDISDPTAPVFATTAGEGGQFRLAFGIENGPENLILRQFTTTNNQIQFDFLEGSSATSSSSALLYSATFSFTSNGVTIPGTNVMFNSQPAPAGFPINNTVTGGATFSLNDPTTGAALTAGTPVEMTLRVKNGSGAPVALNSVPEPSILWLFGCSLLGLIGLRRRKSQ